MQLEESEQSPGAKRRKYKVEGNDQICRGGWEIRLSSVKETWTREVSAEWWDTKLETTEYSMGEEEWGMQHLDYTFDLVFSEHECRTRGYYVLG